MNRTVIFAIIALAALPCLGVTLSGAAVAQTAKEDDNIPSGRTRANIDRRSRPEGSCSLQPQSTQMAALGAVLVATPRTPKD
jgi:hypothetical protein